MDFYNRSGTAVAYWNDKHLRAWNGTPIAIVQNDAIYSLKGKHIGYLRDGWIRDKSGHAVSFSEDASGGPLAPVRQIPPIRPIAPIAPIPPLMPLAPLMPAASLTWSALTLDDLLKV